MISISRSNKFKNRNRRSLFYSFISENEINKFFYNLFLPFLQLHPYLFSDVLGTWQHRGNVELYFKHRYKQFNYRLGKLTEYYKFKNVESVLEDLCSMQQKVLKSQEINILKNPGLFLADY